MAAKHASLSRLGVTLPLFGLLAALGCHTAATSGHSENPSSNGSVEGSAGAGSSETGTYGPGGDCDIRALMASSENGCTNAGCHGEHFQGGLDLLSAGLDQRLVGAKSSTAACGGELLVDPSNVDNSLLLRVIDPVRFASSPCGVMMPFGKTDGVSAHDLSCFEGWVRQLAQSAPSQDPPLPFEAVAPSSYVNKVKTLLVGSAPTAEELASVTADAGALKGLVKGWLKTPEFEAKLGDYLRVALQQKLVGTFDAQFQRLRGNPARLTAFKSNAQESFVRTAVDIVTAGKPFTQVLTTQRFAVTTALLSGLAYLDKTETELKAEKHGVVREPTADMPPAPLPLDYSVQNHVWQVATLPDTCSLGPLNADNLFEMLLGFVQCKGGTGYRFEDTALTAADFEDWRFVEVTEAKSAKAVPAFYDLATLRGAKTVALRQPRVGFFTTPAFLANWETNEDNQFRVTTSQTVITALGSAFSPADATQPVRLDGLAKEHAAPGTTCYGCHQFIDPMREYFAQSFAIDFQRPEEPSSITPSFAFDGYVHDGGNIRDLAQALADHPAFARGWTQKLCYWANSQPCAEKDPEFLRIAQAFEDSGFDFETLLSELMSSPLVTGAALTDTFKTQPQFVSITRKQHLCRELDARLGVTNTCGVAASFASLVPEDDFSRGAAEPVQTAVTGLFHYAAVEKLCSRLAVKLVGSTDAMPFQVKTPDAALDDLVEKLMGLSKGTPRHDSVREALGEHFTNAKATTNATTALRSAFIVACVSPEVQALGL